MDLLSHVWLPEARAVICELNNRLDSNGFSSFSPAIYDTAWLAMIRKPGDRPTWLFPECFNFLLHAQNDDGGWPSYASEVDGILNTVAATVALKRHRKELEAVSSLPEDIEKRISKAEDYTRAILQKWDVNSAVHVGFEILVPNLLGILEEDGERFDFPGREELLVLNAAKLSGFSPEILYGKHETTLVHSLEAFVGKIDFDKIRHRLDEHGSMMASPSSTAAFLMQTSEWDESAEKYLRNVVALGSGKGNGGVPSAFPSSVFEAAWIASTFLKAVGNCEDFASTETARIGRLLQSKLGIQGGIVGFDSGLLADADDTAKVILTLNLLGLPTSADRLITAFESASHFRTYREERDASFSTNCNVLDALLHCPDPGQYIRSISKAARFLCNAWNSGRIKDKWNLSEHYVMMLLSQAFWKLLQIWDSGQLSDFPEELIHIQIPVVLFQIMVTTLQNQSSDGSWGLKASSREITAYAVLTLKAVSTLPWVGYFNDRIQVTIKKATTFLAVTNDESDRNEYIWVEKVTYALPPLSRAYCLAALCSRMSCTWSEQIVKLVNIPTDKVLKLSKFFARLPIFSKDEPWTVEAAVAEGFLWLPRLMGVSSDIFPRENVERYRYVEYIPFTWIGTNGRKGNVLSNNLLWEMMVISLLEYQLDHYMESVVCSRERLEDTELAKALVRRLCTFPSHSEIQGTNGVTNSSPATQGGANGTSTNGLATEDARLRRDKKRRIDDLNGPTNGLAPPFKEIESVLSRFTSYVFDHVAVLQSPTLIRRDLHRALEACLVAHINHEEDNASFAAQQTPAMPVTEIPNAAMSSTDGIQPFLTPRTDYYTWVTATSAPNTHCPFSYHLFTILASPDPSQPFFRGVKQHWLSANVSLHLSNTCRIYNDYGSVARDAAEGNLNSLNFPPFHEGTKPRDLRHRLGERDEQTMRADLWAVGDFERECLDHALDRLDGEVRGMEGGGWKMDAMRTFLDVVDVYGQLQVARDITPRVK